MKETVPQVARANLGGPDLKDKINIIILLQSKTVRTMQREKKLKN